MATFTNPITATIKFMKEAKDELKKVSWPSRPTTIRYTAIVIISSVVLGMVMGGLDSLFTLILKHFIS